MPIHDAIPGLTDLEGHALEALVEAMARHTVAVIPHDGAWLGSGVCVLYGRQAFLATAAHVVSERPLSDIGVVPKAPAPLHVLHVEPTRVISQNMQAKGYKLEHHMALEFARTGTSEEELQHPRGLSGAGVWSKPSPVAKDAVWDPRSVRFAGIAIGWLERRQVLIATRVESLVELLKG